MKQPKLVLKPNEQVLYPQPYVEQEYNPLIVTTLRVQWTGENKKKELDAAKIGFTGKGFHKKFMTLMLLFGLIGLPFFAYGGYTFYTYKDKPTEAPKVEKGQKSKPLTQKDLQVFADNRSKQIIGIVTGIFGAALVAVAYLLYKRRLTVIISGQGKALEIPVKDAMTQDKLLMMVNAAKTSAAAMVAQPMPVGDKVQKVGAPPPKLSKK